MKRFLGIILCFLFLLLSGCSKTPKLVDGKEPVAKFDEGVITTEELYEKMKDKYAQNILIDMIDTIILNKHYKTDDNIINYVNSQINYMKTQAEGDFLAFLQQYGLNNEQELKDILILDRKRYKAAEDYVASIITDTEINKYYKEEVVGDIKASHILIKPEVAEGMTSEEINTKEQEALQLAEKIIEELSNGKDFSKLAKQYSADKANADDGGDLGYFNKGAMAEEFEEAAYHLEVGKYTLQPVKTTFGYHIILKTDQKDKPTLDSVRTSIINSLVAEKIANDNSLYNKGLMNTRKKSHLNIYDKTINKQYNEAMKKLLNNT